MEFFLNFIDFRVQFVTDTEDRVVEVVFLSTERDGTSKSERAKRIYE
jgi:hypothetical protein